MQRASMFRVANEFKKVRFGLLPVRWAFAEKHMTGPDRVSPCRNCVEKSSRDWRRVWSGKRIFQGQTGWWELRGGVFQNDLMQMPAGAGHNSNW